MRVVLREDYMVNGFGIWVMRDTEFGTQVAEPANLTMKNYSKSAFALPEPTFRIQRQEANQLFQEIQREMVRMGLVPNSDVVTGKFEAQSKHLEDMRKLVFEPSRG